MAGTTNKFCRCPAQQPIDRNNTHRNRWRQTTSFLLIYSKITIPNANVFMVYFDSTKHTGDGINHTIWTRWIRSNGVFLAVENKIRNWLQLAFNGIVFISIFWCLSHCCCLYIYFFLSRNFIPPYYLYS